MNFQNDSPVKKIALLMENNENTIQALEFKRACERREIEVEIFDTSEPILEYQPDFIIVATPEHAKLTPYPTYGLINRPKADYLGLPRYLRNILTYDGYLTTSTCLREMLQDVMFGTRKLNTEILYFDFLPALIDYAAPEIKNDVVIFVPELANNYFKKAINLLLKKLPQAKLLTFSKDAHRYQDRTIFVNDLSNLQHALHNAGIAICLHSGDEQEGIIFPEVMEIVVSSAVAVVHHTSQLENIFGDALYYIPGKTPLSALADVIDLTVKKITHQPELAIEACKHAHQHFTQSLALDDLLNNLLAFHQKTLITKGFVVNTQNLQAEKLPSVSYIMRTGGKHRAFLERALNCLVAQNYPDLRLILVIHADFDYLNEILTQYRALNIKVIRSIKSLRSEAIRDGMAAVETELFGLFDDDDELFPNHVRSLISALQYHNNRDWRGEIGMVYSGSIHADDTHEVPERFEYHDHKLKRQSEKRAVEHFKFYSSTLMSRHAWFMPNGWLARSKLIDNELLIDPKLDTCEDYYLELLLAQKTHFAFSMEMTAVHHFHHFGNSTICDSDKHVPDSQRIALRNLGRVLPPDAEFDTHFNLLGRSAKKSAILPAYVTPDTGYRKLPNYFLSHPFFPRRAEILNRNYSDTGKINFTKLQLKKSSIISIRSLKNSLRFLFKHKQERNFYIKKFVEKINQVGFLSAVYLAIFKLQNDASDSRKSIESNLNKRIDQDKTGKQN